VSAPELHADDLLDREIRGVLTIEERARLEEHLAVCSVCRFERTVRADFRAEFAALGPSQPQASKLGRTAASAAATRHARVRLLGMVAVLLLLAGVAGAELSGKGFLSLIKRPTSASPHEVPAPGGPERVKQKRVLPAPHAATADTRSELTPEAAPAPPEALSAVPQRDQRPVSTSSVAPGHAAIRAGEAAPVASTAGDLFDEARAARERGDYAFAVERYERLLALFPSSPQALTTQAVLGRLLLDRGEPAAALRHFDAYLASGATTLAEEALLGRALAFGKLGQGMQEAEAWQALLRQYPGSVHASRAKERLSALAP
jgi:TolA-binding protein